MQAPDQELNVSARASSQFIAPMLWSDPFDASAPERITGFSFVTFSWDTMFRSAVPSFVARIDVVLSSPRAAFTLRIKSGAVESVGWGAPSAEEWAVAESASAHNQPAHYNQPPALPGCRFRPAQVVAAALLLLRRAGAGWLWRQRRC